MRKQAPVGRDASDHIRKRSDRMTIIPQQVIEALDQTNRVILSDGADIPERLHSIAVTARKLFHAASCSVYLYDPLTASLRNRVADGEISQTWMHTPRVDGLGMSALLSGRRTWEADREHFNPAVQDAVKLIGVFPLHRWGTQPLGVAYLHYATDPRYTEEQLKLMESFFRLAGLSIHIGAEREQHLANIEELKSLSELGLELVQAGEYETSLRLVATVARKAMRADCVVLFCFGEDRGQASLHVVDNKGIRGKYVFPQPRKNGLTRAILKAKSGIMQVPDLHAPPPEHEKLLSVARTKVFQPLGVKAFTAFALRSQNAPIGALYICSQAKRVLSEEELRAARFVAQHASARIQMSRFAQARRITAESEAVNELSMVGAQFAHRIIGVAGTLPFDIDDIQEIIQKPRTNTKDIMARLESVRDSARQIIDIGELLRLGNGIWAGRRTASVPQVVKQAVSDAEGRTVVKPLVSIPSSVPSVVGIRVLLVDILANLLNNAVKAGAKRIHVHVRHRPTDNEVDVIVKDNGRGMSRHELKAAFLPKLALRRERGKKGLHIGLYVSRWQVARMGGRMEAQSTKGKGASFTVTLRVARLAKP